MRLTEDEILELWYCLGIQELQDEVRRLRTRVQYLDNVLRQKFEFDPEQLPNLAKRQAD